jgi:tellurite resistance protein TerC
MTSSVPLYWWIGFHLAAGTLLVADLAGLRHDPCISLHKSLRWALAWLSFAALLAVLLYFRLGHALAIQFTSAYLLEQTLSVDNLFLFFVLFRAFAVPTAQQHRVLTWGVLGAILMRGLFLVGGLQLLAHFHFVTYVFGLIVLATGIVLLRTHRDDHTVPGWLRWLLKHLPVAVDAPPDRFFFRTPAGMRIGTLFVALIAVELTDLVFALDSIPAVLSISRHAFVVYTSNILAVLSLRSLFPAVVDALRRFHLLHYGVACILIFVGFKMLLSQRFEISATVSLAVIAGILGLFITLSLIFRPAAATPSTG